MKHSWPILSFLLLLITLSHAPVPAQKTSDTFLTPDQVLYLSIRDLGKFTQKIRLSPYGGFLEEKELNAILEKHKEDIDKMQKKAEAELDIKLDHAKELWNLIEKELALSVAKPAKGEDIPSVLLVIGTGSNTAVFMKKLKTIIDGSKHLHIGSRELPGKNPFTVHLKNKDGKAPKGLEKFSLNITSDQNRVLISNSVETLGKTMARLSESGMATLSQDPGFIESVREAGGIQDTFVYFRFDHLLSAIENGFIPQLPIDSSKKEMIAKYTEALGAKDLSAVSASMYIDPEKKRIHTRSFISIPENAKGLFTMLPNENVDTLQPSSMIGKDTFSFSFSKWNPQGIWSEFKRVFQTLSPPYYAMFNAVLQDYKTKGIDIERDMIGALGNELGFWQYYIKPYKPTSQIIVFSLKLKDSKKLQKTLNKLLTTFFPGGNSPLQRETYLGYTLLKFGNMVGSANPENPMPTPAIGFLEDRLIFSISCSELKSGIRRKTNTKESISYTPEFKKLMLLQPGKIIGLSFNNYAPMIDFLLHMLKEGAGKDTDVIKKIPSAETINKYLKPVISFSRKIKSGMVIDTYQPW